MSIASTGLCDAAVGSAGACGSATRQAIKRQVRDAFYTDTDAWKDSVVAQGVDAAFGALRGLGGG